MDTVEVKMYKSLVTPGKYYQGKDILNELYSHIEYLGKSFVIITDEFVRKIVEKKVETGFVGTNGIFEYINFNNESTEAEALRIAYIISNKNIDGIIGIGGGKVIDTSKYVSDISGIPLVIIPTSASSDAPCSAISVIYDENGRFIKAKRTRKNPDMVLVDTMVISQAPERLLIAGMGDAFATYYEARACNKAGKLNYTGGNNTEGAFELTKLCNDILLENGLEAKNSVVRKEWSMELEKVVEANIYLSGVGFENNGCAIAHAMYNGMTSALTPFNAMHGEGVAFGTIVQLVTEYKAAGQWNREEFTEVVDFYKKIGLPLSFKDLGIDRINDKTLMDIALATSMTKNAKNMPFDVTPIVLFESMVEINKMFDN